jgi:hypothetical protein
VALAEQPVHTPKPRPTTLVKMPNGDVVDEVRR